MPENPEITQMLRRWRDGDNDAYARLLETLYDDVRIIAGRAFAREGAGHTLQATAVANEALLRIGDADITWQDRSHFLAVVATATRRILVDHARARAREKRGGEALQVTFATEHSGTEATTTGVIELHEALEALGEQDARKARILELHYFSGLTYAEISEVVGISEATVHREIRFSKAWLKTHLQQES